MNNMTADHKFNTEGETDTKMWTVLFHLQKVERQGKLNFSL